MPPHRARRPAALRLLQACLLSVLLAASPATLAWGALGHRLVAALAQAHLGPAARREVAALLAGEPDPTLAGVATWADHLRDDHPDLARATARWHYADTLDPDCAYLPPRDCAAGGCAYAAIEAQRRILADRAQPLAVRREALKWLVHLVADLHQPLHASHRRDRGGNAWQVSLRRDGRTVGTSLHAVWDYDVLDAAGLRLPAYLARLQAAPWPPRHGGVGTPLAWAEESCRLVDARGLYPPGHKLDARYLDAMRPLAEERLRVAAWRLAALLDATLGPARATPRGAR
ncbi:MAG: S1/P1 nuclease [Lysobacteraceae bacterium]